MAAWMASCMSCRWPAASRGRSRRRSARRSPRRSPSPTAGSTCRARTAISTCLGPDGKAPLPTKDLEVAKIRSPLTGPLADAKYDWYTNYGDFAGTNANDQGLQPPLRMRWARRLEGTDQAPAGLRRRPAVHAHGRRADHRRRAGHRPAAVAALLARRLSVVHVAALRQRQAARSAGRHQAVADALPRRGHGQARCGKPPSPARRAGAGSSRRSCTATLAIYASGSGEYAVQGTEKPFTFKGTPRAGGRTARSHGLDLLERQSVLSEGQPPAALGLGPRYRQGRVAEGFFRVRPRRQRLRHLPAGRQAVLFDVLRLRGQPAGAPRPAAGEQRPDRLPRPADGRRRSG